MKHKMKLHDEPFNSIKAGTKTIELRLNDEKRQLLKENDTIEFTNRITNETILTEIVALHKYPSFEELYKNFDKISMGYRANEEANPLDMEKYYSKEEQKKNGVLGIEIKLLQEEKQEVLTQLPIHMFLENIEPNQNIKIYNNNNLIYDGIVSCIEYAIIDDAYVIKNSIYIEDKSIIIKIEYKD